VRVRLGELWQQVVMPHLQGLFDGNVSMKVRRVVEFKVFRGYPGKFTIGVWKSIALVQ